MACGRPAVVFAEGGGPESVVPGETGIVFDDPTPAGLRAAVDSLEGLRFNVATLRQRAEEFSRHRFESRLETAIEQALLPTPASTSATWSDSRHTC
jgi:glycosyltransferase involved in cell wall biosynthesis